MNCIHGIYDARCCSHCSGLVQHDKKLAPRVNASHELVEKLFAIGAKPIFTKAGEYRVYFRSKHRDEVALLSLSPLIKQNEFYSAIACKDAYLQLVKRRGADLL